MAFDQAAYVAASKTLQRTEQKIRVLGRLVLLEHESTTVPGRFVGGKLETWRVSIRCGASFGFGFGEAYETLGSGDTRADAIAEAEKKLRAGL